MINTPLAPNPGVVALNRIRTDGGTQSREELNTQHIANLAELLVEGGTFKDPIIVFYDGLNYWLADGFHRYHAARQADVANIPIEIKQGTQEDAIEHSCGANATHGLIRTTGDIRRAVERLIELPKWQNRKQEEIARQCGASQGFVSRILNDKNYYSNKISLEQPVEPVEEEKEPRIRTPENDEEKRKRVETYIVDNQAWDESNREIAKACEVSEGFVRKVKKGLVQALTEEATKAEPELPTTTEEPEQVEVQETEPELETPQEGSGISPLYSVSQGSPTLYTIPVDKDEETEPIQELEYVKDEFSQDASPELILDEYIQPEQEDAPDPGGDEEVIPDEEVAPAAKSATLTALQSSESNEWYTPAEYVKAARKLMGSIDVDPASCERANKVVQAEQIYTQEDSGLNHDWTGHVWLNPPYGLTEGESNQAIWSKYLMKQFEGGPTTEAVLLVNANTEAKWFQPLYEHLICFTDHRIRFYNTNGESSQPTQGNALIYFGSHRERFIELFSHFGVVVEKAMVKR